MIKELYDKYIEDKNTIWQHRLTWKGLYGDMPKYSITLVKFLKSEAAKVFWDNIADIKDVLTYRRLVEKTTKEYVKWVHTTDEYSPDEDESLVNFSMGAFGEIFYIALLSNVDTLVIDHNLYHFYNVAPLTVDEDFGVDGTATYTVGNKEVNCALQIKFWNPFIDTNFTLKIAQGVYAQAVVDNIINPSEDKNVIICWLGTDKHVSTFLKNDKAMYKKIVFIDMKTLDTNINKQVPIFWRTLLPDFIKSILN